LDTKDEIVEAIKTIIDPDLFIDIWTLGLIYDVEVEEKSCKVTMTFTSVACPAGPMLVDQVKTKTEAVEGVDETQVEITFQPPWEPSEDLKAHLGLL